MSPVDSSQVYHRMVEMYRRSLKSQIEQGHEAKAWNWKRGIQLRKAEEEDHADTEKFQKQDTVGAFMTSQCDLELACRAHLKRSGEGNHKFYDNCKDTR